MHLLLFFVATAIALSTTPTPLPHATRSVQPSASAAQCIVPCVRNQSYYTQHSPAKSLQPDPVWLRNDIRAISVCNASLQNWIDGSVANTLAPVDWVTELRAWIAVLLTLASAACTEPMPAAIAIMFDTEGARFMNPTACFRGSVGASQATESFIAWSNGEYADLGGPCACGRACIDASRSIACCVDDRPSTTDELILNITLCNGQTVQEILIDEAAYFPVDRGLYGIAATTVDASKCALSPIRAQQGYAYLVDFEQRRCAGDGTLLHADIEYALNIVQDYLNGSYGLLGGPCRCTDAACLRLQTAFSPEHASDVWDILDFAAKNRQTAQHSRIAAVNIVIAILLVVVCAFWAIACMVIVGFAGRKLYERTFMEFIPVSPTAVPMRTLFDEDEDFSDAVLQ